VVRSIFLVGFMGAGKTSVGEVLAARLGFDFIDLDQRLNEKFGASTREIFARHGEDVFRAAESDELARCTGQHDVVVATGGGAFCSEKNRQIIRASGGLSVFLDLPWDVLEARLAGDHAGRPKYADAGQAQRLFGSRLLDYRQATVSVELAGSESAEDAADLVLAALEEAPCVT
jgi:shikimate kinase